MASVTGYTAEFIEKNMVIDGEVVGDNLILKTPDGTEVNAGDVRGPIGYGSAEIHGLLDIGRALTDSDETVLYDAPLASNKKIGLARLWAYITNKFGTASSNDIYKQAGSFFQTNPNKVTINYTSEKISTVVLRNDADSGNLQLSAFTYDVDGTLTSIAVTASGTTVTYTLNYTTGALTSITKAVS